MSDKVSLPCLPTPVAGIKAEDLEMVVNGGIEGVAAYWASEFHNCYDAPDKFYKVVERLQVVLDRVPW